MRSSKISVFPKTKKWFLLVENINSKSKSNIFIIENKNSADVWHKLSQLAEPAWTVLLSYTYVHNYKCETKMHLTHCTDWANFYNASEYKIIACWWETIQSGNWNIFICGWNSYWMYLSLSFSFLPDGILLHIVFVQFLGIVIYIYAIVFMNMGISRYMKSFWHIHRKLLNFFSTKVNLTEYLCLISLLW